VLPTIGAATRGFRLYLVLRRALTIGAAISGVDMTARRHLEALATVVIVATAVTFGIVEYRSTEPRPSPSSTPAAPTPSTTTLLTPAPDAAAIAIVGDSLTLQARKAGQRALEAAGWRVVVIDAQMGRRINVQTSGPPTSGLTAVQAIRATYGDPLTWVIELGTNDAPMIGDDARALRRPINALLDEIGPGHRFVWVNVHHGPRPAAAAAFNRVLEEVASLRTDLVVADWAARAWLSGYLVTDGVHLTPYGADAYASMITDAAQRAAQAPNS
jgi:lysophospholipase L1-like esterase